MSQPPYPPSNEPADASGRPADASGRPDQPAYGQQGYPAAPEHQEPSTTYGQNVPPDNRSKGKGLSIAALVLGLLALALFFVPLLGVLLGIVAVVLGVLGLRRAGRGMAIAGIVLGALALIIGGVLWYLAYTVGQDCLEETGENSGSAFEQCLERELTS